MLVAVVLGMTVFSGFRAGWVSYGPGWVQAGLMEAGWMEAGLMEAGWMEAGWMEDSFRVP